MRIHGFLHVEFDQSYSNLCSALPSVGDIAHLGIEQTLNGETWRFLEHSLLHDGSYIGWKFGDLYREGTYGKIYKAFRMVVKRRKDTLFDVIESPEEVVIKSTEPATGSVLPLEDVTAHTSEALLHVLAWRTMSTTATPWAIPRPYEVFGDRSPTGGWKSMSFCMSYVNGRILHSFIQKHWKPTTKAGNTRSFLEILGQIAYILYHLQCRMRLNHRDIKVNNIMIRKAPHTVRLELDGNTLSTEYEITVIDFGFACMGVPPPQAPITAFQAGSWFSMDDLCCKAGRDIAQLIFCIHCYFPIEEYFTPLIASTVRTWMMIGNVDILNGFTKTGRPLRRGKPEYHTGIYEFLRHPDIDLTLCEPKTVFKACVALSETV